MSKESQKVHREKTKFLSPPFPSEQHGPVSISLKQSHFFIALLLSFVQDKAVKVSTSLQNFRVCYEIDERCVGLRLQYECDLT